MGHEDRRNRPMKTKMPLARFGRRAVSRYFVTGWIVLIGGGLNHAQAQQFVPPPPPPAPPPPPPVFNPSTPYTVPNVRGTPVSPGLPSKLPDSSFCSVFDLGPCFPQFLPPIGQDLRLTIVSTDNDDSANTPNGSANKSASDIDETAHEKSLDSIREMYAAALKRCAPLHFSKGMAGAVAGRPIAIRFVDERTLANSINKAKSVQ
jgi:hypothetical protein